MAGSRSSGIDASFYSDRSANQSATLEFNETYDGDDSAEGILIFLNTIHLRKLLTDQFVVEQGTVQQENVDQEPVRQHLHHDEHIHECHRPAERDRIIAQRQHDRYKQNDDEKGRTPYKHLKQFISASDITNNMIDTRDITTSFSNGDQARLFRKLIETENNKVDPTIPTSLEQRRALVGLLVQAFKSVGKAEDNENVLIAFKNQVHDNILVESVCWNILELCIKRCSSTKPLQSTYGITSIKKSVVQNTDDFCTLFDNVVDTLATFKCVCKQLFDPEAMVLLVDDPVGRQNKTRSNKAGNKTKGDALKIAKGAKIVKKPSTDGDKHTATANQERRQQPLKRKAPSAQDVDDLIDHEQFTSSQVPSNSGLGTPG